MDGAQVFHKRPMAGIALGALLAVLACGALPDAALLPLAAAAFLGGLALLYRGMPFAALLCSFALLCFRIVLLPGQGAQPGGAVTASVSTVRDACDAALDALFGENGGAAKGILLGDKTDIPRAMLDQYRRSGLSHILAVSGLHITILCTALQLLLRGLRPWASVGVTVLFLVFYGALTGFSPSFCCIYGMLMLTQPLSRLLRLPGSGFFSPATAFAVQLGIFPVAAYYFSSVSTVGVVLSILVVPLIPLFIVPAFFAMLLYFVFPGAAHAVAVVPNAFLNALNAVCAWTDALPVTVPAPPVAVIALYLISLLLLSPYFLPNAKRPPYLGLAVAGVSLLLWVLLA